jgi:hypothetical protein
MVIFFLSYYSVFSIGMLFARCSARYGQSGRKPERFPFFGDTQPYAIHAEGLDVIFGGAPPPTSRESVGYRNVIRVNLDEGGTIRDNLAAAERDILAQRQFNPLCLGCNILFHEGSSFPSAFLLEAPPVPAAPEVCLLIAHSSGNCKLFFAVQKEKRRGTLERVRRTPQNFSRMNH